MEPDCLQEGVEPVERTDDGTCPVYDTDGSVHTFRRKRREPRSPDLRWRSRLRSVQRARRDRGGHGDGGPGERRAAAQVVGGNDAYHVRRAVGQPGDGVGSPVGCGSGLGIRGDVPAAGGLLPLDGVAGDGRTPIQGGCATGDKVLPPADATRFCDGPETAGVPTLLRWFWDTRPWTAPRAVLGGGLQRQGAGAAPPVMFYNEAAR